MTPISGGGGDALQTVVQLSAGVLLPGFLKSHSIQILV